MQSPIQELKTIIDSHLKDLQNISEEKFSHKPAPAKWSKKEIVGHMIDSAQSNIRRFIVAQYEDTPTITYKQDTWVAISNYQQWDKNDLINLWYLLNKQICMILENTTPEMLERQCQTEQLHTIEWLANDYVRHLKHHLHVVLDLEPFAYR